MTDGEDQRRLKGVLVGALGFDPASLPARVRYRPSANARIPEL
jgi:hypothetical protein